MILTSFKSYDFACSNRDMPLCGKWNVFVPYDSKHLEIYVKLLKMLTLPSLAGFCEVLKTFLDVKWHTGTSERGLT